MLPKLFKTFVIIFKIKLKMNSFLKFINCLNIIWAFAYNVLKLD